MEAPPGLCYVRERMQTHAPASKDQEYVCTLQPLMGLWDRMFLDVVSTIRHAHWLCVCIHAHTNEYGSV